MPLETQLKVNLHPRNKHRNGYDFKALISLNPELSAFIKINPYGNESINFADPKAVKALNKTLLMCFYGITWWDIPEGCLCPPVPGRADYIHTAADLLTESNNGKIPTGPDVKVLDIGTGANCIYPIIGRAEYGWNFTGTDINPLFLESAEKIVKANAVLNGKVELRIQKNPQKIFKDIILPGDYFDLTLCNPPFHASAEEALKGTSRKIKNLTGRKTSPIKLNFGGADKELWCEGGEKAFVTKMILESALYGKQCRWFTTLISKKENLPIVYHTLKQVKAAEVRTLDMAQGQKISRAVCWRF